MTLSAKKTNHSKKGTVLEYCKIHEFGPVDANGKQKQIHESEHHEKKCKFVEYNPKKHNPEYTKSKIENQDGDEEYEKDASKVYNFANSKFIKLVRSHNDNNKVYGLIHTNSHYENLEVGSWDSIRWLKSSYKKICDDFFSSIILKLVHPLVSRLNKSRYIWNRGRKYRVMQKLDPLKVEWIIRQKEKGVNNSDIVSSMKVTVRWIQKLYSRYRSTRTVPALGKPGRPKRIITEEMTAVVESSFMQFRCCAVFLEKIIDAAGTHIPHNTIHQILRSKGLASRQPKKSRKRRWVRYERTYSNSMWHILTGNS